MRLRLAVEADGAAREMVLTVSDSGIGMSAQQLALASKPYHTIKRTGLGVGLALVKRIMERFGGSIRLDSREKQGTDVHLIFRLAEQE